MIFREKSIKRSFAHIHCMLGRNRLIFIYVMIIPLVIFFFEVHANARGNLPFHEGEKITFQARWGLIPAGESILEVLPSKIVKGVPAYHFSMITETNRYIDLIYKVRERQDSYVDTNLTHTLLYTKQSEGKHPRNVVVNIDWERKTASYNNFGEEMNPVSILPGTFDPLSLIYVIRLHALAEGTVITIPVTDGKTCIPAKAEISRRESIIVLGKQYDAVLVESDLEVLDKDGDGSNLKIWFTADDRKVPIRMQFKRHVIEFTFDIVAKEE